MGKRAPADSWPVQLGRDHLWEKEAQVRMWSHIFFIGRLTTELPKYSVPDILDRGIGMEHS